MQVYRRQGGRFSKGHSFVTQMTFNRIPEIEIHQGTATAVHHVVTSVIQHNTGAVIQHTVATVIQHKNRCSNSTGCGYSNSTQYRCNNSTVCNY